MRRIQKASDSRLFPQTEEVKRSSCVLFTFSQTHWTITDSLGRRGHTYPKMPTALAHSGHHLPVIAPEAAAESRPLRGPAVPSCGPVLSSWHRLRKTNHLDRHILKNDIAKKCLDAVK